MLTPQGLVDSGMWGESLHPPEMGGCQGGSGSPETAGHRRGATVYRVVILYLAAQGIRLHGVGWAFGRSRRVLFSPEKRGN